MKSLPIAAALALAACASEGVPPHEPPPAVALHYAERSSSVNLPVACDEFGGVLGFVSDTADVWDPAAISELRLAVSEAAPIPDSAHVMDARLVAYFYDRAKTDTVCVGGRFGAEVNGVPVVDSALVRLLWSATSP
ncbi:hypothetical protein RQM47_03135 [Rubrivirga sp. S365]|uniref:Lipoprotein n=1 Tax=Rubrivirga litoralis TaxID=3075598 RepID=A0ABU3BLF1_9BACT|nr:MULTISPECIES: hypothetical protein [unclassified Rubrivirga]MDT0630116.1 hypothetical protein [Rubrivirga sp. F394]MDT7855626.1 hypothetical protein [Rubrivirga sp. S365]